MDRRHCHRRGRIRRIVLGRVRKASVADHSHRSNRTEQTLMANISILIIAGIISFFVLILFFGLLAIRGARLVWQRIKQAMDDNWEGPLPR